MAENMDTVNLRFNQISQIIDQYRTSIYTLELRFNLLIKMLEEKKLFAVGEFNNRWPLYLKNDIGIIGPEGTMEGTVAITMYGMK